MNHKTGVVFDTNIFISAIIFGGNPRTCLELAKNKEIELYTSRKILVELSLKLRLKFRWKEDDIHNVIEGILVFTNLVTPKRVINLIKNDPKDNIILECAQESKTDYIISGDKKHLLCLNEFKNIPIITAKLFLDRYYKN
ncbi:putative toxin-antitoxin system toxin component, PIN family [Patescibacteria group bacterium]|nr:putative toxin-antitoxin system toxin component, PIN family [Patescibacteria group bacterium]